MNEIEKKFVDDIRKLKLQGAGIAITVPIGLSIQRAAQLMGMEDPSLILKQIHHDPVDWQTFDNGNYPRCEYYWLTDFVKVDLMKSSDDILGLRLSKAAEKGWLWGDATKYMPVTPPVPEEPFHYCVRDKFICAEHRYGNNSSRDLKIHYDDESLNDGSPVESCPFCGFKLKSK